MDNHLNFIESVIRTAANNPNISLSKDDSTDTINSWDSLVTVSLATALSSEYGIELDIDQLEKITSVKGIIEVINQKN